MFYESAEDEALILITPLEMLKVRTKCVTVTLIQPMGWRYQSLESEASDFGFLTGLSLRGNLQKSQEISNLSCIKTSKRFGCFEIIIKTQPEFSSAKKGILLLQKSQEISNLSCIKTSKRFGCFEIIIRDCKLA